MKRFRFVTYLSTIVLFLCFEGPNSHAQHTTPQLSQATIETLIDSPTLSQSVISICAITGDGQPLVDINSSQMLVPASNMKLISTGAAMHKLGPDYRFETSIGHDGEIIDGVLKGNLYIIGGGDPTLGSLESIATPIEDIFAQWAAMVKNAGITLIDGCIIGDGRLFGTMIEEPTWLVEDIGTYYGAGTTGLMFYENMQSFNVSAGLEEGADINISPSYPEAPWMDFRYNCTTGKEGTGDQLFMFTSDLAPIAEIRGTFGVDRKPKRLDCSNKFPEYTCAHYFSKYLNEMGMTCKGVGDFRLNRDWETHGQVHIIGKTYSPDLSTIISETNHVSNNVYAETLLRSLGLEALDNASYDSSYVAINKIMAELNVDTSRGYRIKDGSGLSRQNYISSDFLCRFLKGMMDSPNFDSYVESLPSPGGKGTLQFNMEKEPEELKARIKVKSGSMNGVRCYSGYIIPTEGTREDVIIFSIMVNNCTSASWEVRSLLDSIMAELARQN